MLTREGLLIKKLRWYAFVSKNTLVVKWFGLGGLNGAYVNENN